MVINKPVIFVQGTTASGKSDWALKLAQEFEGSVVNCDSVQAYKKLDIGSAKPSLEERSLVPHFLYDYVQPPEEITAGNYARDFFACMENQPEGKPVFVVGGTGFYFMAIEKGMYPVAKVPADIHEQVESEINAEGGNHILYRELLNLDPEYAMKINIEDHYRIARAIELIRSQGKSMTQIQKEFEASRPQFPFPLLKIGPTWEREVLRARIRIRTDKMIQSGLLTEVRNLLAEGLEAWAPLSSVGYKESIQVLKGELSESKLAEQISVHTAQLAKKQRTWFQRDPEINWFPVDSAEKSDNTDNGFIRARALVENFLKT